MINEKSIRTSFGYVKKDLMKVNDNLAELHSQIQHLSLNQASLLGEITKLSEQIEKMQSKEKMFPRVIKLRAKTKKTPKKAKAKTRKVSPTRQKKVVKETITYS